MTNHEAFFAIADSARSLVLSRCNQRFTSNIHDGYPEEFRTCKICCGRQVGSSSWIASRATNNDLIVVANYEMANYMSAVVHNNPAIVPISKINARNIAEWNTVFDTTFVDNPSLVFSKMPERNFMDFLDANSNTFVFVGI